MDDSLKEFMAVTGSDEGTAQRMLEAFSGNLQAAVSSFLDGAVTSGNNQTPPTVPDEVRAPIPQTKGVLIDDYETSPQWMVRHRPRSVFDGFRNFKSEEDAKPGSKRLKRLEDLFRPPLDIMHKGTFHTAKGEGSMNSKWLIVNVQNIREFVCQVLNRDVWSNSSVKSLIKEHFVFWQVYSDSSEGERFMNFYSVTEWPHVSILDPRTGGRLAMFKEFTKESVISQLTDFIDNHGVLEADDGQPPSKKIKHDIWDSSEEIQMAAAIAASLEETKPSAVEDIDDEESLSNGSNFVDASSDSRESPIIVDAEGPELKSNGANKEEIKEKVELAKGQSSVNGRVPDCNGVNTADDRETGNNLETSPPKRKLVKIFPKKSPSAKAFDKSRTRFVPVRCYETDSNGAKEPDAPNSSNGPQQSTTTAKCRLMLRLPDGKREKIVLEEDDTLKDLMHVLATKGLETEKYEVLTNFPQKLLSTMDQTLTLKKVGLCPQETVFVREKL
uniref:UBX domain-containing protein 7-like n=1 Tax=Phallusia mammillata TaxID=59560 RepID=A0A6F9DVN6_9ASCI|nr:UBX domain-containing protein 7-like [Phallusia mammillata]